MFIDDLEQHDRCYALDRGFSSVVQRRMLAETPAEKEERDARNYKKRAHRMEKRGAIPSEQQGYWRKQTAVRP